MDTVNSVSTTASAFPLSTEQMLHSLQLSNTTHTELVFLEKLLLRAVKAHLQWLQMCTTLNNSMGTCKEANMIEKGNVTEVYAMYVHFFTAVQDFTR